MLNQLNVIMEILLAYYLLFYKSDWLKNNYFDIQLFLCHPIRELLVSVNQSYYLIYSMFSTDPNSKETSVYQITSKRLRSQIYFFIFLVLLSKTITFKLNSTTLQKKCDSQGRTRWYWYRWHLKEEFTKNSEFFNLLKSAPCALLQHVLLKKFTIFLKFLSLRTHIDA